jgi:DNA-binding transcriptional ArsR family regulator
MVKYADDRLDALFAALADRTRRAVIAELAQGSRPVSELAAAHDMSLPGFMKHLAVLEAAGLIERAKEGRVVQCTLHADPMQGPAQWIARYEEFWTDKLDALGRFLYQEEELQKWNQPASSKDRPSPSRANTQRRPKRSGARGRTRRS